jgi:hypothetical protein
MPLLDLVAHATAVATLPSRSVLLALDHAQPFVAALFAGSAWDELLNRLPTEAVFFHETNQNIGFLWIPGAHGQMRRIE